MEKRMSIHDKAIRLIEGGIVDVDGHAVELGWSTYFINPCIHCDMGSLCHVGTEMCAVCEECDRIKGYDCYLNLVESKKK